MSFLHRSSAAAAALLAVGAGPALATTPNSSGGGVKAHTRLTAKIAYETPYIHLFYSLKTGAGENARTVLGAEYEVSRVPADPAQYLSKLEWLLGAREQQRGDNVLGFGLYERTYHHTRTGNRAVAVGLTHLRLANYYLGNADSTLGVRHPKYATAPYPGKKTNPIRTTPPLLPTAPAPTLTGEAGFASPVLAETIREHVPSTSFALNQAADAYYATFVGRMHVDAAQLSVQKEWVDGVRDLLTGDDQIIAGSESISGEPIPAAAKRKIAQGFTTLRHANSLIAQADARLGVHPTEATVTLPTKVRYTS